MTHWECTEEEYQILVSKGRIKAVNGVEVEKPKESKYHSNKTEVDGIMFDSLKEANYYCELKILVKANTIQGFELQPKLELQPAFEWCGQKIKAIYYKADFKVTDNYGHEYYVDTKGFKTKEYLIKKKMLLYRYPGIDFREE